MITNYNTFDGQSVGNEHVSTMETLSHNQNQTNINQGNNVDNFMYLNHSQNRIANNINIERSTDIHVGHVIHITENITLNAGENDIRKSHSTNHSNVDPEFPLITRSRWLATPPKSNRNPLELPVKYVIICHTATEECFTQAESILTLNLIQTFHMESCKWSDISYNFIIGSDGNVYEGRGWNTEGAHTLHYNKYSIGIAFIGCFSNHLPPSISLTKCKNLIEYGMQIGAIDSNYQLLAHSQCRPFESPGQRLFDEIRTWNHFNSNISVANPIPLLK